MFRRAMLLVLLLFGVLIQPAFAATYYISPTGSTSNNGLSTSTPWLTFAHALDPSRASCGDMLLLMNGVYGDGTSTGKISLSGRACTAGNELVIRALNERQARIHDSGLGNPIRIDASAHITILGLTVNSTNNPAATSAGQGQPIWITASNNIKILRSLGYNPNKNRNDSMILIYQSRDVLVEMWEGYDYHRHCVNGFESERVVVRLSYCNGRSGMIAGGYDNLIGVGASASMMSMYPCKDCILESSINEGANNGSYLNEMNATFGNGLLLSGSKVLGNVCLACNAGNGIYINSRFNPGTNYSPQKIMIENNAFVDFGSIGAAIRVSDGIDVSLNKNTVIGNGSGITGLLGDNSSRGGDVADLSMSVTNNVVIGMVGNGFIISDYNTWSGSNNYSYRNGIAFSRSLPSNWSTSKTSVTSDPQLGTCKVWRRDGSAAKAAGAGANILYRYSFGVETRTPLWDQQTGEFPHGALVAGVNDARGQSAFDVHERLNVNTNGCSFPANYGDGVTDLQAPSAPRSLAIF